MQKPTAKYWTEVTDSYGRVGEKTEGPEWTRKSIERPKRQLTWTSESSQRLLPTKEHTQAGLRPLAHMLSDKHLSLHVGPPTTRVGSVPKADFLSFDVVWLGHQFY